MFGQVQLLLSTLHGNTAAVSRFVDMQGGPVVLVGHSYGGNVITEAGAQVILGTVEAVSQG